MFHNTINQTHMYDKYYCVCSIIFKHYWLLHVVEEISVTHHYLYREAQSVLLLVIRA